MSAGAPPATFAADTALVPDGPQRWRGTIHERWWVVKGPFGGTIAALMTRALMDVTDHPPRTLAVHFVDAPAAGEVEVRAQVERRGRSTDAVSLRVEQDGRVMALGLANAGDRREEAPAWDELAMPDVPRADALPRLQGAPVAFLDQLDVRWEARPDMAGEGWNRAWIGDLSGEPLDAVHVAALSDVWMPPAFLRVGMQAIVPTLDLTVHWRAPVPRGTRWLLAVHRTTHASGGTWTCDGTLWAPDGTVLAQARQLALLRMAR